MGIVRNCIDVVGITPEGELPKQIVGQLIEASETENIYLGTELNVKNIYQIVIEVGIKGTRVINAPLNKIIVVDGIKKIKAAYYNEENNVGIFELEGPLNFFIDIDKQEVEIESINIHIADAYFHLTNKNTLYNHILYMIDVPYNSSDKKLQNSKLPKKFDFGLDESDHYETDFLGDNCEIKLVMDADEQFDINSIEDQIEQAKEGIIKELLISEDKKINISVDEGKEDEFIDIESEYL